LIADRANDAIKAGSARRRFVDEIPHTATGKIRGLTLRQPFKDYVLPTVQVAE
jgi:acyl-coenzyme A synthetase/AMP-(fatty) acid ligase